MQQKCAFIEKVIFLPSGFPKCRALIHLPDISQRTFIGQHVFSVRKGSIIRELSTGPVVLASTEERAPTWCLEYDPEFYGGQLSSLPTGHATISPSDDSTSTEDMKSFRTRNEYYQKRNSGLFDKFPQEVSFTPFSYGRSCLLRLPDLNSSRILSAPLEGPPAPQPPGGHVPILMWMRKVQSQSLATNDPLRVRYEAGSMDTLLPGHFS